MPGCMAFFSRFRLYLTLRNFFRNHMFDSGRTEGVIGNAGERARMRHDRYFVVWLPKASGLYFVLLAPLITEEELSASGNLVRSLFAFEDVDRAAAVKKTMTSKTIIIPTLFPAFVAEAGRRMRSSDSITLVFEPSMFTDKKLLKGKDWTARTCYSVNSTVVPRLWPTFIHVTIIALIRGLSRG
ncbi:hypothetical protein CPB85DRAFT_1561979 [Mucidula mucida]|nr:hypothetical protein CPB85DRAFT_1561979 [Mucidula mucida]